MTPSARTYKGSIRKGYKGSTKLCPRGSNESGFSISQNNAETHIKLNNQGIISALQRLIELSNNKNDIAKYQEKVAETHKELELIEASIRIYKNDVDAMTIEIKHLMDMLLVKAKELFDLSILLMKEKKICWQRSFYRLIFLHWNIS